MNNGMKSAQDWFSQSISLLLAALLAGGNGGCVSPKDNQPHLLTEALWEDSGPAQCEPAANPDLVLYEVASRRDVLVEYSAIRGKGLGHQRLAYFLEANRTRVEASKAPRFVDPKTISGLKPIPCLRPNPPADGPVPTNCCVVENGSLTTFYRPGFPPEDLILPRFQDNSGKLRLVILTPVAVVGDVAIVGVALGLVGVVAYFWGGSGSR